MRIFLLLLSFFYFLPLAVREAPAWAAAPAAGELAGTDKINVIVSLAPQRYFVQRIGGELVRVTVLVKPGADPHSYEPSPAQMVAASNSSLYFTAGLGLEQAWAPRIREVSGRLRVISLAEAPGQTDARPEPGQAHGEHQGHLHQHEGHPWLSPAQVKKMIPRIVEALAAEAPAQADFFRSNAEVFMQEVERLDREIRDRFKDIPESERQFMTFHPAWRDFAEDYGLREIAIESDGKEPGPKRMAELIKTARAKGIRVIFVEPQFPQRTARAIADNIPAQVITVDPLAEEWADNLLFAAGLFADSLK